MKIQGLDLGANLDLSWAKVDAKQDIQRLWDDHRSEFDCIISQKDLCFAKVEKGVY